MMESETRVELAAGRIADTRISSGIRAVKACEAMTMLRSRACISTKDATQRPRKVASRRRPEGLQVDGCHAGALLSLRTAAPCGDGRRYPRSRSTRQLRALPLSRSYSSGVMAWESSNALAWAIWSAGDAELATCRM